MLLDTSGLLSYFDKGDARHRETVEYYGAASTKLTHSYVLAELVPLAHARGLPRRAALAYAVGILDNPEIEVVWVNDQLHRRAMSLLQARLDRAYSVCDAVSFVLMRERGITDALTTDHHFQQEGFRRLLK